MSMWGSGESELAMARMLMARLIYAQGGVYVITEQELVTDVDKFEIEAEHNTGMLVIRVRKKE